MDYLPVFLRIRGRGVLVVGGGEVALRKVRWVLKAGAQVTLAARELHPELLEHVLRDGVRHAAAQFSPELLREVVAVIAATDVPRVNAQVAAAAQARALPVNVVDDAELSTFIFPAIVDRSPLIVAVSSAGHAPVLARRVREQIEALLPARLGALGRFMGAQRHLVQRALGRLARRPFWERLVDGPVATHVLAGADDAACRALERELFAARLGAAGHGRPPGEVYLIGAGPGDPDLLTLRALQLLQRADVILYDRLVSPGVLERARRDAQRIFVGRAPGEPGQQDRIHALMVSLAGQGKRVARLKGGDPFVFGRGGEEMEVLAAHGIPCQVVPGITAALGAAAAAAVPLTHRRLAQSVTLVTGHVSEKPSADWRYFADPGHTVVFYMGVAQLPSIIARLRAAGAAAVHPAAIIERATWPEQRILRGTLADIARLAGEQRAEAPALLITGAVAALGTAQTLATLAEHGTAAGAVA
jgi:uroporphyrin-III C-methyltransferase/precorrin-2 dehydrogenase/sirohydrochlorin ferrochelatase